MAAVVTDQNVQLLIDEVVLDGAQQHQDPLVVHRDVLAMFPELDLTQIIIEFGHMTPEGLAGLVIDRMAQIPKKQQGIKRKVDDGTDSIHSEYSSSSNSEDQGDLLIDKMLSELLHSCKSEIRSKRTVVADTSIWPGVKGLMMTEFPAVRAEFVTKMLQHLDGAIVPTAIACFFAENNFGNKLYKIAPNLNQTFWCKTATPIQNTRKRSKHIFVPDFVREHFKLYNELMEEYQKQYPELLCGLKLTKQAKSIPWERSEQEQRIECLVCFDQFLMTRMICCSAPVASHESFFADSALIFAQTMQSSSLTDAEKEMIKNTAKDAEDNGQREGEAIKQIPLLELSSSPGPVITIEEEIGAPPTHAFCHSCIRGQAQAATDEIPLADGGVGLKCMVPDCKNPILYSDIRVLLKREIRRKLDERIIEENIGMASIQNLERCKLCNFAVEMEVDKHINKVFDCLNCGAKFCRICERRWDEEHFGITCEELDVKLKKDKKERELEKQLNEAVIRKCPRCGLAFMKDKGCNKMTCRCGMKQCYICRQSNIGYDHFCQHLRDPSVNNWKCKQCSKKCLLYQDANKIDSKLIEEIRKRKEHEEAGEGTSQQPQHSGETNLNQQQSSSSNNGAAQDDPRVQPAVRERAMAANREFLHYQQLQLRNERPQHASPDLARGGFGRVAGFPPPLLDMWRPTFQQHHPRQQNPQQIPPYQMDLPPHQAQPPRPPVEQMWHPQHWHHQQPLMPPRPQQPAALNFWGMHQIRHPPHQPPAQQHPLFAGYGHGFNNADVIAEAENAIHGWMNVFEQQDQQGQHGPFEPPAPDY